MRGDWTTIEGPEDLRLGALMPAWFIGRMMADDWKFGLLLSTGQTLLIRRIDAVHISSQGQVLLDVDLLERGDAPVAGLEGPVIAAPTGRVRATVNLAHLVAAFEVADADEAGDD